MTNIQEIFGCQVFNETVMQSRLPKDTYRSLIKTIKDGKTLDERISEELLAFILMFLFIFPFVFFAHIL